MSDSKWIIGRTFKFNGYAFNWVVVKDYTMLEGSLHCVVGKSEVTNSKSQHLTVRCRLVDCEFIDKSETA